MARRKKSELYLEQIKTAKRNNRNIVFETSDLNYLEKAFMALLSHEKLKEKIESLLLVSEALTGNCPNEKEEARVDGQIRAYREVLSLINEK